MDEKEEKQSIFDYNFVIAAALLLIVAVVVIILVTNDQSKSTANVAPDTIQTQAIPLYPGVRRIVLSNTERDSFYNEYLIAGITQQDLPKVKTINFEVYGFKSEEKLKALEYYSTEMVKQGWATVPPVSAAITDIKTFTRNKKYATVTIQALDSRDVPAFITEKYQTGEIGMVLLSTDADLYRLKAGK